MLRVQNFLTLNKTKSRSHSSIIIEGHLWLLILVRSKYIYWVLAWFTPASLILCAIFRSFEKPHWFIKWSKFRIMEVARIYFIFTHPSGDRFQFFHWKYRKKWLYTSSVFPVILVKKSKPVAINHAWKWSKSDRPPDSESCSDLLHFQAYFWRPVSFFSPKLQEKVSVPSDSGGRAGLLHFPECLIMAALRDRDERIVR